jgi:hypothetical protein
MVLSPEGGALANMVPIFKWGLGGRLGSGRQWISWIALEDVVGVVQYILHNEALSGPVNLVSPEPVRQKAFARQLASALHRPALCPTPEFVLHLVLGEMANAVLLSSSRIQPAKLQQSGYAFREPNLQNYLERHLGKK